MSGSAKVFKTLGAFPDSGERGEYDLYVTDPKAAEWLLRIEDFPKDLPIWECASGLNHLANVFKDAGYDVRTSDLVKRLPDTEQLDFLNCREELWHGSIVTNPPYKFALEFVYKALSLLPRGCKLAMFLRLLFLESRERRELFEKYPPVRVWVSSSRIKCLKNNDRAFVGSGGAMAFAWFVWIKGYEGETVVKWFN